MVVQMLLVEWKEQVWARRPRELEFNFSYISDKTTSLLSREPDHNPFLQKFIYPNFKTSTLQETLETLLFLFFAIQLSITGPFFTPTQFKESHGRMTSTCSSSSSSFFFFNIKLSHCSRQEDEQRQSSSDLQEPSSHSSNRLPWAGRVLPQPGENVSDLKRFLS